MSNAIVKPNPLDFMTDDGNGNFRWLYGGEMDYKAKLRDYNAAHASQPQAKSEEAKIIRVEVIEHYEGGKSRHYVNWDTSNNVELSYQDNGRTLKIFITRKTP